LVEHNYEVENIDDPRYMHTAENIDFSVSESQYVELENDEQLNFTLDDGYDFDTDFGSGLFEFKEQNSFDLDNNIYKYVDDPYFNYSEDGGEFTESPYGNYSVDEILPFRRRRAKRQRP
jgi:hypothetical protein